MNDVASIGANIHKAILDAASDALGLAILVCDKNDEIVFASRQILQFYPIPAEFLQPGTRLRDFLGAVFDVRARSGVAPERTRRSTNREGWISESISHHWRERYETVERISRQRWVSVRKRRISSGLCIVALSDVSEQKKREEQMQLDLERIELTEGILDSMPNPICVKDRALNYVAVNKAFCAIHGMPAEAILGRSVWDLLEPELAEKFELSDRAVLETGKMFSLPEQMVRADGDDLWVITRKFRIGEPGKYLLITCMNDVTDVAVGHDAEHFDGHGPGLHLRDYGAFEPAQNCYDPFRSLDMQHVVDAGSLIEQSSPAVSRRRVLLTTGNAVLERQLIPLLQDWGFDACAVRTPAEQLAFQAAATQAGLTIDLLLLDAASKGIKKLRSEWQCSPTLLVAKDWSADMLRKEIAQACGTAASQVTIDPIDTGDWEIVAPPEPVLEKPVSEIDVLVAEDNEINQFVFAQILEGLGLSYRIAVNGKEAVALWHRHRPRLVLMDVAMPVMNGFDAARDIRTAEKNAMARTPIVAVMAHALDLDIERALAAGMDDHITKPISPDMIENVYRRSLTSKAERIVG